MQDFSGKKIILGICGGVAAYKSTYLIRELTQLGAEVRVVMTESAQAFITPLSLQALGAIDIRTDLFDMQAEKAMGHIELARWADYLLIAPATANFIAKMAQGFADDLLSTLYLAADIPVVICPAMNRIMWQHAATKNNCRILAERGVRIVAPDSGGQACGEFGEGRLAEMATIINRLRLLELKQELAGRHVIITAGPTRESLDPVRFLSNHSSGLMGYALAEAAFAAGAEVHLVSGPVSLQAATGIIRYDVVSGREMHAQVLELLRPDSLFIACAAVADYAPVQVAEHKIKKQTDHLWIELQPNPDILAEVGQNKKAALVVGFAAETENLLANARHKLLYKGADVIIANNVSDRQIFGAQENEVILLSKEGEISLALAHKWRLAAKIIAILAASLQNGAQ